MAETKQFEGRTEEEAVAEAAATLGLSPEELDYTVLDEGSDGVLGLGKRPVQIRVRIPEEVDEFEEDEGEGLDEDLSVDDASAEPEDVGNQPARVDPADASVDEDASSDGIVGPAPEKAASAKEVAEGLATRMGIRCSVEVQDEDRQIVVLINEAEEGSTDVADTLGRSRPPAIPSFQFLLNKIVNRFPEDRKHIVVEVPSVPRRERRSDEGHRMRDGDDDDLDPTLVELARMLAERALELNRVITVHPMAAGDRRSVHKTIVGIDGVQTVSEGEGLYRRIHIVPDALRDDAGKKKRRRRRRRRPGAEGEAEGAVSQADGEDASELDEEFEDA